MRTWAVTLLLVFATSLTAALYTSGRQLTAGSLDGTLVGRVFAHREELRDAQMDADLSMDDEDYLKEAIQLDNDDYDLEETDTDDAQQFDDDDDSEDKASLDDDDDGEEQETSGTKTNRIGHRCPEVSDP